MITIIGPTASGKTSFAASLAYKVNGEILSGDSRQIYKLMDLGTGKDLKEYVVKGRNIQHHLINIREPGEKYTLFDFQKDFYKAYNDILSRNKTPILCGGSGLYIESVLRGFDLQEVPINSRLRQMLATKSIEELSRILTQYKTAHNITDFDTKQRAIRAIEIAKYQSEKGTNSVSNNSIPSVIIGLDIDRDSRRSRISKRLQERLREGMIEEVENLLGLGVQAEDLIYYGLEYKFVTLYVIGEITYKEMFEKLEIAIHQFAKRQMTWFRGMERRGLKINWIDALIPLDAKIELSMKIIKENLHKNL